MKSTDARIQFGIGAVLLAGALAIVGRIWVMLLAGRLDARPKHSSQPDPNWLIASEEPLWFHGILGALTLLAVYLLVLSWRMMRDAWRDDERTRGKPRGRSPGGGRP